MQYPYQNPDLSVEARVEDLLSRMTLKEKLAQMRLQFIFEKDINDPEAMLDALLYDEHPCGACYNTHSIPAETINAVQKHYLENTRLGIPLAIHGEALHGCKHDAATVFPQAIGLGATFNPELMEKIAEISGKECRSHGITMVYDPNLDVAQDPRWGRTEETMGEDPYLIGEMGVAFTRGLQSQGVAACPKHFAMYGVKEGGLNLSPSHVGEHEAWETMLPPFQKVIDAGAMGIMPGFSVWEGVPSHANRHLMVDILRDRMGFQGQTVSDYGALIFLRSFQRVAENRKQAGIMAMNAQIDMEACKPDAYGTALEEAILEGSVSQEQVNRAVRRILWHKFAMGLFENPYASTEKTWRTPEAIALARKAAEESVTLLKNENSLLPLSHAIGSIAIIGPNADHPQLGDYTAPGGLRYAVSLKKALEEKLGAHRVRYAKGCGIAKGTQEEFSHAMEAITQSEAVVVVLGDNSNFHGGIGWGEADPDGNVVVTCGEGFDVHTLELPECQQKLLEAAHRAGKPVILILETGRPYAIRWAKAHIPAIIQAWYPGEQGGYALTDILFGDTDPSGRLPISFPRSVGHIPSYYNHKVSARGYYHKPGSPEAPGRDYIFDTPDALFTFGEGLSYTTFAYSDLSVEITGAFAAKVTVTLENIGTRRGCEVAQLYVSDRICRITPFVRRLRGFQRVWLEPGESKCLEFALGFEDFSFVNESMEQEAEPGEFVIAIGSERQTIEMS